MLIYILLPASEFRCVPVRVLLRVSDAALTFADLHRPCSIKEVAVNLAFIPFIDMYSDPDAVNQLIITMVIEGEKRRFPLFPLVLVSTNSVDDRELPVDRANDGFQSGVEHLSRAIGRGNESMAFEGHRRREWSVKTNDLLQLVHQRDSRWRHSSDVEQLSISEETSERQTRSTSST